MRAFASVALLFASAAAVSDGYYGSHSQLYAHQPKAVDHTHYDDDHEHHHHTQPVVHVDVWETIDADILALQEAITAQQEACDASKMLVMELSDKQADLAADIKTKGDETLEASEIIAAQKVQDDLQTMMLTQLNEAITKAEADVRELQNMAILLDMIIEGLPDISALEDQLALIVAANVDIKADADANELALSTMTSDIMTGLMTISDAEMDIASLQMKKAMLTDSMSGLIAVNEAEIAMTEMAIEALAMKVLDQTINSDYFFTNPVDIEIMDSMKQCLSETFCLPADKTLDFQLAATTQPSSTTDGNGNSATGTGEIHTITLELCDDAMCMTTSTVVAQSTQEIGDPVRGRSHTLLYRTGNDSGMLATYQVCYEGVVPAADTNPPKIEAKNLQFGARVYNSDLLQMMPTTMCPS